MGKAGILPIGYPPLLCTEAKERRLATRSQPPKRTFPAPIWGMISVVDTLSLSRGMKPIESIFDHPVVTSKECLRERGALTAPYASYALIDPKKLTKPQTTGMLVPTKNTKATNGTNTFCWPTENCGLVQRSSKQKGIPPASLRERRPRSPPLPGSREAASTPSSLAL
jgi:hypothetical protein